MEEITDVDYMYGKRVCKDFEIKNLGEYHDLYLKVIHYFWLFLKTLEKCLKIYKLDPAKFLLSPGLAW